MDKRDKKPEDLLQEIGKEPKTLEERLEWIRKAAYYRAEHRGFAPGADLEDWLEAESEVDDEESYGSDPKM